ncbi:MAG: glycosyltransferase [Candidatus Omnitrophica bacterium]|nr:glycosyltransferase [Candidatus Omnitrophota bacterium]
MIFVILAIYNEEKSLQALVEDIRGALRKEDYKIIAVDDGSSDRSHHILLQLKKEDMIIAKHRVNLSIGAVFSTGFNIALKESKSNDDIVIVMESDQTSDSELLQQIVDEIRIKGKDVSIASRYIKGGGYINFPLTRRLYSFCANNILRRYFPIHKITDYTIFYRSYRIKVLRQIMELFGLYNFIHFRGFVSNSEILIKASCFTRKISEIPFLYNYGNKKGKSKLLIFSNILEYFYFIFSMKKIIASVKNLEFWHE